MIVYGLKSVQRGDKLAVDAGVKETASVLFEKTVHGVQNASGVGACKDTALGGRVDVDDVVENRILRFVHRETEVRKEAEAESVRSIGIVNNVDLTALRHHHTEVFFEFFRREINHVIRADLLDLKHKFSPSHVHIFP